MVRPGNGVWLALLALPTGLLPVLRALLGSAGEERRRTVLAALAFGNLGFLALYKLGIRLDPAFPFQAWNELPLHPCNVVALLLPAAVLTDSRVLKGFCLHVGTLAALFAFAMPVEGFGEVALFSIPGLGYYGFHGLVLFLSAAPAVLGLYVPRYRDLPGVLLFFVLLTAAAHGVNLLLRAAVYPDANYFFTCGLAGNPLMEALRAVIPWDFWFELPLLVLPAAWGAMLTWLFGRPAGAGDKRRILS